MSNRHELIADRMEQRLAAICKAVPPIEPEPVNWLHSDASESYCSDCILPARGTEFDGFYPLRASHPYRTTEWEEAFHEGIGTTYDGESDHTEACTTCGKTLRYILTDYGVEEEINHYLAHPVVEVRDEDSYALDRLILNINHRSPRAQLLGAAAIINQAWRIVQREGVTA